MKFMTMMILYVWNKYHYLLIRYLIYILIKYSLKYQILSKFNIFKKLFFIFNYKSTIHFFKYWLFTLRAFSGWRRTTQWWYFCASHSIMFLLMLIGSHNFLFLSFAWQIKTFSITKVPIDLQMRYIILKLIWFRHTSQQVYLKTYFLDIFNILRLYKPI
jgi:hypothetical protein